MGIDMRVDMCVDLRVDMCGDMRVDMGIGSCVDTCADMHQTTLNTQSSSETPASLSPPSPSYLYCAKSCPRLFSYGLYSYGATSYTRLWMMRAHGRHGASRAEGRHDTMIPRRWFRCVVQFAFPIAASADRRPQTNREEQNSRGNWLGESNKKNC